MSRHFFFLLIKTHRFVFNKTFVSFKPSRLHSKEKKEKRRGVGEDASKVRVLLIDKKMRVV
jgi:hypothetical protein